MKPRTKFWWKLYFWLTAALAVAGVLVNLHFETTPPLDVVDYVDNGMWLVSIVGVFGYAYSKVIVSKHLWRAWLPIVLLWDTVGMLRGFADGPSELDPWFLLVVVVVGAILMLPEYLALFLYGYRSEPLWASRSAGRQD